jgi:hypothetical protein
MLKMKLNILATLMLVAALAVVVAGEALAQPDPCQGLADAVDRAQIWLDETEEYAETGGAGNININPDVIEARQRLADAVAALEQCREDYTPTPEPTPEPTPTPLPDICDDGQYGPWPEGDPHNDCPGFK